MDYTTVKIPKIIAKRIEAQVSINKDGYRSVSEWIIALVRKELSNLENEV